MVTHIHRNPAKSGARWMAFLALLTLPVGLWINRERLLNQVRYFNRCVLNPITLRSAGRPGVYDAVVEHVGRRSGRAYRTPVVALPIHAGFITPLPYGTKVDWLRNVQAAGGSTVRWNGRNFRVSDPSVIDASPARSLLAPARWWFYRQLGIRHFVRTQSSEIEERDPMMEPSLTEDARQ
jgi:deazaflavin-dependent oxidoreductase (nitroreductase family)